MTATAAQMTVVGCHIDVNLTGRYYTVTYQYHFTESR